MSKTPEVFPFVIKPMLAFPYESERFVPGMFVQPKLDGVRALYQNGNFVSRDGKVWDSSVLKHIHEMLKYLVPPNMILDGELYKHGLKLQEINSRIAVNRTLPHRESHLIEYHVFDVVHPSLDFFERFKMLIKLFYSNPTHPVQLVPTYATVDTAQADLLYNTFRKQGYEGIMYRHPEEGYSTPWTCRRKDNRSWALMKRKGGFDLSGCKIIGILLGDAGKYQHCMGRLVVTHPEVPKPFDVGSGFSDLERQFLWDNRERLDDCYVDIKFDEYSKGGIPLRLRATALHLNTELANLL